MSDASRNDAADFAEAISAQTGLGAIVVLLQPTVGTQMKAIVAACRISPTDGEAAPESIIEMVVRWQIEDPCDCPKCADRLPRLQQALGVLAVKTVPKGPMN